MREWKENLNGDKFDDAVFEEDYCYARDVRNLQIFIKLFSIFKVFF